MQHVSQAPFLPRSARRSQLAYRDVSAAPALSSAALTAPRVALAALGFRPVGLLEARFLGDRELACRGGPFRGLDAGRIGAALDHGEVVEVFVSPDGAAAAVVGPWPDGASIWALLTLFEGGAIVETAPPPPQQAPGNIVVRLRFGWGSLAGCGDRPRAGYHLRVAERADAAVLWAGHRRRVEDLGRTSGQRPADHTRLATVGAIGLRFEQVFDVEQRRSGRAAFGSFLLLSVLLWGFILLPSDPLKPNFAPEPLVVEHALEVGTMMGVLLALQGLMVLVVTRLPRRFPPPLVPAEELVAALSLAVAAPEEIAPRQASLPALLPRSGRYAQISYRDVTALAGWAAPAFALRAELIALGFRPVGRLEMRLVARPPKAVIRQVTAEPGRARVLAVGEQGEVDEVLVSPDGSAAAMVERRVDGSEVGTLFTLLRSGAVIETATGPSSPLHLVWWAWPLLGQAAVRPREHRPRSHYDLVIVATDRAAALWGEHRRRVGAATRGDLPVDHRSLRTTVALHLRGEQVSRDEAGLRERLSLGGVMLSGIALLGAYGLILIAWMPSPARPDVGQLLVSSLVFFLSFVVALVAVFFLASVLGRLLSARLARSPLVPADELLAAVRLERAVPTPEQQPL